ncbi:hypothetical protein HNQ80_003664 [Anaerosolibacter carboniphilus]|uniref:Uncharacterized protein n=1 Tax=Anaerosolibacter carboniphilus TaxID=1417629 RepID=A0A841KVS7_9FIRM|nr:hypothetical protein [Anaerosolibacter carboniphilus]MBB6217541.1 hypothetical protein [Anaerosolibacter carboniphilus]
MEDKIKKGMNEERKYEPAELLCKQIELLAEESKIADPKTLVELSNAMVNLYIALNS